MNLEDVAIDSLNFDPVNARKHPEVNLSAIRGSLAKFGQQKPIVVGKNNVVLAGNGTLAAAKALGWTTIKIVRTELTGPEAIAFALADNRTSELAEWDTDILSKTLTSLRDIDFDLESIGFDDDFMKVQEPVEGLTDSDEVPQEVETRCKPGDLWLLGEHRLLCGDSTNVQHVERLMGGEKADMVFTDPPYGMNLDADFSSMSNNLALKSGNLKGGNKYEAVKGDGIDFSPDLINTVFACFGYCNDIFLWGADYYSDLLPDKNSGSWMVWDKRSNSDLDDEASTASADKMFGSVFELCWSKAKHRRQIARVKSGIFGVKDDSKKRVHPTQKPVQLAEWFFERWGSRDDVVADLFLGSGSTLIACEKTGRRCFGMEIEPKYCDVILARWEAFTGNTATLASPEVSP